MLPALGAKLRSDALAVYQEHLLFASNVANFRDGNACDSCRYAFARMCCKKQLVSFAAVEGETEIYFMRFAASLPSVNPGLRNPGFGDGFRRDFGTHAAFFAHMSEIGGEAIADVDHR